MTPTPPEPRPGFLRARLSPDNYLGLHLTVGLVIMLMAVLVFGHIAEDVITTDAIVTLDLQIAAWFHAHEQPALTVFFWCSLIFTARLACLSFHSCSRYCW